MTRASLLVVCLSVAGCTQGVLGSVGADPAIVSDEGRRTQNVFPDLARTPKAATGHLTSADKARLERELDAARRSNDRAAASTRSGSADLQREAEEAERRRRRRIRNSGA